MKRTFVLLPLYLLLPWSTHAQKRPLDHSVYDNWQTVTSPAISKSGKYILFQVLPQEGDGTFYLKSKENNPIAQVPRGYFGQLTADENYLITLVKAPYTSIREAKIKKKKADDMPKDSIAIYDIKNASSVKFAQVKSYKIPKETTNSIAFLFEKAPVSVSDSVSHPSDTLKRTLPKKGKHTPVPTLVLYNPSTGDTVQFGAVDQFEWNKTGSKIAFSKKADSKDTLDRSSGVYLYDLTKRELKKITPTKGTFKSFTFDESGEQLAYLGEQSPEKALFKPYKLYYYTSGADTSSHLATQHSTGVPKGWTVSGDGNLRFSKNGEKLFFGVAPVPRVKDTTLVDFEHAKVDVWSWNDDYLQPMQLVNVKRDMSRNYLAVIYPKLNPQTIPLVDSTFNNTLSTSSGNEEYILATTNFGRRIESQWEGQTRRDVYLVSTKTGHRELLLKDLIGDVLISPDAKYVVYFDQQDGSWNAYNVASKAHVKLTDGIPVSFADEENDMPTRPDSYGFAGWTPDFKGLYVNTRYDIWYLALNGDSKSILTNGYGVASQMTFRYLPLRREEDRDQPLILDYKKGGLLSTFDHTTKESGFYTFKGQHNDPKKIIMAPNTFRNIAASADQQSLIYTKENYQQAPNIFVNDGRFKSETQLSEINLQQQDYNWGTAELVHWTTPGGHAAEGILYKPEDFDPSKKYPIIAYFYEKLSDGLYTYQAPAPTPSRLNIPYFVSNGYLVFAPDINYEIGHPGKSAEEYINSGMRFLAQNSWVDSTKMGIQGQSWGGYQVAHLITRTPMYAAAWAGAPVVNMTSAYGGIRWQTGMSRQFQYEHTQSRIGKTLWEDPQLYIENSPLFHLDKVTTPVVIMANDNDGAVPWYQGIEMFTALRRLQKPVWMLNYNGDEHNLMQRQNRKDIQIREQQFFDHYLKGAPQPKWLKNGIPATLKGIEWGLDF